MYAGGGGMETEGKIKSKLYLVKFVTLSEYGMKVLNDVREDSVTKLNALNV